MLEIDRFLTRMAYESPAVLNDVIVLILLISLLNPPDVYSGPVIASVVFLFADIG